MFVFLSFLGTMSLLFISDMDPFEHDASFMDLEAAELGGYIDDYDHNDVGSQVGGGRRQEVDPNLELPSCLHPNLKLTPRATAESHNAARLHHENLRVSPVRDEPLTQPQFGPLPSCELIQLDNPFGSDDMVQYAIDAPYDLTPLPPSSPPPNLLNPRHLSFQPPPNPPPILGRPNVQAVVSTSKPVGEVVFEGPEDPRDGDPPIAKITPPPSTKIASTSNLPTHSLTTAKGCMPQATKDNVQNAFQKVNSIFHETAAVTGHAASQLISMWNQTHARTTNGKNEWNKYQAYFADNSNEERARDENPTASGKYPHPRIRPVLTLI